MEKLGIIAGNGKFPLILAEAARRKGLEVVAAAFDDEADPAIEKAASRVYWIGVTQLGKLIKTFRKEGVTRAVMAGQVKKRRMYTTDILKLDLTAARLWAGLPDKKGDTILRAVADELSRNGIELVDSTMYLTDQMADRGPMTRKSPGEAELRDIEFGLGMARVMAEHDIGQSVAVKDLSVVAVEAVEGTNECILRAGGLARGAVIVKTSRAGHDMRFDVPVVGLMTIEAMREAGAAVLAVEAGRTLMIEKDAVIKAADESGICIVGV